MIDLRHIGEWEIGCRTPADCDRVAATLRDAGVYAQVSRSVRSGSLYVYARGCRGTGPTGRGTYGPRYLAAERRLARWLHAEPAVTSSGHPGDVGDPLSCTPCRVSVEEDDAQ